MNLHLTDQVAFIAGSSRGIGRAIAATLLDEGARIVITGRDPESLTQTHNELATPENHHRILAISGNFADTDTIEDAFNLTISRFGRIDHLIANLGTGTGKPGWQQVESEWIRLFDANFFASVRLAQAAVPHLRRAIPIDPGADQTPDQIPDQTADQTADQTPPEVRTTGQSTTSTSPSILFLSSITAVEATPAPLPYSAAKAALNNYAKNLARLLAPEGIRVNTIAPGNIFFPGGSWERHLSTRKQAVEHMLQTEVPQNRFGTPEEIASLAAYLCSPHAAFSTGSTYIMDGGQTRSL